MLALRSVEGIDDFLTGNEDDTNSCTSPPSRGVDTVRYDRIVEGEPWSLFFGDSRTSHDIKGTFLGEVLRSTGVGLMSAVCEASVGLFVLTGLATCGKTGVAGDLETNIGVACSSVAPWSSSIKESFRDSLSSSVSSLAVVRIGSTAGLRFDFLSTCESGDKDLVSVV